MEPVLVVGAGPVGMTAAMALRRLGVAVRIVDKAAARTDKSKALVIWSRTLELLDVQGCADRFVAAGVKGRGVRLLADRRELVQVALATARTPYPFALLLAQSETERLLEAELAALGVTVERGVALTGFAQTADAVQATLQDGGGRTDAMRASWLVGCDGAHSLVRHGLGVPFAGRTEPSNWLLADLELEGELTMAELTICWRPEGVLVLVPMAGRRYRVIADVPTEGADAPPSLAEVQILLDSRGPEGLRGRDPHWLSRFRINERKVADYRRGRVFLAGDAAHIHSPAGGQGMNTGMQDAFNLAWKLALVWHGRAGEGLLASYSPERSAIGERVLRNASRLTHAAILRNPLLQRLRNAAVGLAGQVPALRQRLVDQLTELDLNYAHGPLTGTGGGRPAPGRRAPDALLRGGGRLHRLLEGGRFVMLAVGCPAQAAPDDLGALVVAAEAQDGEDYAAAHHYLIRPDAYVAMVAGAGELDGIATYLGRLQRQQG